MGKYFKIIEHELYNDKLNKDLKIVHLSDIHYGKNSENNFLDELYQRVADINPDYIVISGDIYNTVAEIKEENISKNYYLFFINLQRIAPVFTCIGNHETMAVNKGYYPDNTFLNCIDTLSNVHVLDDKVYEDDDIIIGGYTLPYASYFDIDERKDLILRDMQRHEDVFKITNSRPSLLLTHSPEKLRDPSIQNYITNYDLICTGHMHNGMLLPIMDELIPGNGGIISPVKEILPKSARGTIELENDSYMILNGGYTKVRVSPFLNSFYPKEINIINMHQKKLDDNNYSKKIKYTR